MTALDIVSRPRITEVKAGMIVKIELIATKSEVASRHQNGVFTTTFKGTAKSDLIIGQRFQIDLGFEDLIFSPTEYIGVGVFNTKNSSYSIEVVK